MSFEGPDADSYGGDEDGHRKRDSSRKRDGKKDKKEKGYTMFEEEDSDGDSLVAADDMKSPSKTKGSKAKPFKFPVRKEKAKEKEEKKDKEAKKEEKEKRREEKEGKKIKKEKKKNKLHQGPSVTIAVPNDYDNPIFGVPLALAVERNKSHDGIELPAIVRECVDYIEECGLACEGIYRISGVKSKVQALKDSYNRHQPIYLYEHEPNIVASLLKQFLRDLPEPVLTTALMPKFEDASTAKSNKRKVELFSKLIQDLPVSNRLLLSWMIVHMSHVIDLAQENKMTLQNVSIVLSPTMRISHRVLNVLFSNTQNLFGDVHLRKYVPPLRPAHSKWSLELPDNPSSLEEELAKQESLLNQLHTELNSGVTDPVIEEQLWEVQRVVTQLKRKIKLAKKGTEKNEATRPAADLKRSSNASLPSLSAPEELKLDLKPVPAPKENMPTPTSETVATVKVGPQPSPKANTESKENTITLESSKTVKFAPVPETKPEKSCKKEDGKKDEKAEAKTPSKKIEGDTAKAEEKEEEIEKEKKEAVKDERNEEESKESVKPKEEEQVKADLEEDTGEGNEDEKQELPASQENSEKADVEEKHQETDAAPEEESDSKQDIETESLKPTPGNEESVSQSPEVKGEEKDLKEDENEEKQVKFALKEDHQDKDEEKVKTDESTVPSSQPSDSAAHSVKVAPVPPFVSMTLLEPVKAETPARRKSGSDGVDEQEDESKLGEWKDLEDELLGKKKKSKEVSKGVAQEVEDLPDDDDASLEQLLEDEYALVMEEEELTAIADELRQKMATERSEMERLAQEIQELHYLRQDSDLEDISSDSNSSDESEDEDDLQDLLSQLIQDNQDLETQNAEMCQKIHEERMICLSVKLQIRLLQQKQLEASCG